MQVKDIMIPLAGSIEPSATLREAAEKMKSLDIDPMPVTSDGKVVGLLSARAIAERAAQAGLATGSVRVSEVLDRNLVCCTADQTLEDAIEHIDSTLGHSASARLPVTDGQGSLLGIVAVTDMRAHVRESPEEIDAVRNVNAVDQLVDYRDDNVAYMSDASFPASDPLPPPVTLARESDDGP